MLRIVVILAIAFATSAGCATVGPAASPSSDDSAHSAVSVTIRRVAFYQAIKRLNAAIAPRSVRIDGSAKVMHCFGAPRVTLEFDRAPAATALHALADQTGLVLTEDDHSWVLRAPTDTEFEAAEARYERYWAAHPDD